VLGETPRHDGLVDTSFLDPDSLGLAFLDLGRSGMSDASRSETGGDEAGGSLEDSAAAQALKGCLGGGGKRFWFHDRTFKVEPHESKGERKFLNWKKGTRQTPAASFKIEP